MSPTDPQSHAALDRELLDVARAAAAEAAALQRAQAGALARSEWTEKGTSDFVTEVDRESERIILRHVRARFPDHEVLAEEGTGEDGGGAAEAGTSDRGEAGASGEAAAPGQPGAGAPRAPICWVIDPLDGTTNWLHRYPEYAVSIAALDGEGLRAALVLNSATGEEFSAARGAGASRDGSPIHVSELTELRLALLGTGFPFKKLELLPGYLRVLGRMLERTSGVRRGGAAALDLCDVACGRLDAFWEHWLMPWDVAAGALIVREAGGTFGPLPESDDPLLAGPIEGGRRIDEAFRGLRPLRDAAGGFMAGNGRLEGEVAAVWRAALAEAPAP